MAKKIFLNNDSPQVKYLLKRDKHLAKSIQLVGPIEYRPISDGYAFLISQIIGQMLNNKVADILYDRLKKLCQADITIESIDKLSDQEILSIGISHSKVQYIRNLTQAVKHGQINFDQYPDISNDDIMAGLKTVKGIGDWSAKMYLIFCLNREDVLPYEDIAFLQGYGWIHKTKDYHKQSVIKKCRKWHPYESIAARFLYVALDKGLTKNPFHLFK